MWNFGVRVIIIYPTTTRYKTGLIVARQADMLKVLLDTDIPSKKLYPWEPRPKAHWYHYEQLQRVKPNLQGWIPPLTKLQERNNKVYHQTPVNVPKSVSKPLGNKKDSMKHRNGKLLISLVDR